MKMTKDEYIRSLSFWTLAIKYLHLVQNVVEEILKQGNPWLVVTLSKGARPSIEERSEQYNEKTRWSDFNLIEPLLFNFYHGLELLVKGFLLARSPADAPPAHHGIEKLVQRFVELFPDEKDLGECLSKYTQPKDLPALITGFLSDNGLLFGQLYEVLRYPANVTFDSIRRYGELRYKEADGLPFFQNVSNDVKRLRRAAVRLGENIEKESFGDTGYTP